MCTNVNINLRIEPSSNSVEIEATVKTNGQTGVEMEALTAANITALTIYDMVKAIDKTMKITDLRVTFKDGGKTVPGTHLSNHLRSPQSRLFTFENTVARDQQKRGVAPNSTAEKRDRSVHDAALTLAPIEAPTKSRNRGCGSPGRLLNSG